MILLADDECRCQASLLSFHVIILQLCSVPNWALAIQLLPSFERRIFSQIFTLSHPDYYLSNSTRLLYQNLVRSVPVLCSYFLSSNSHQQQQQRFRFSKHEESKNRRLFWCFLWGRKNQNQRTFSQLRLFQKHQRTNSFHERTGTEPVTRRAIFFFKKN